MNFAKDAVSAVSQSTGKKLKKNNKKQMNTHT